MSCNCLTTLAKKIKENANKDGRKVKSVNIEAHYYLSMGDIVGGTFSNIILIEDVVQKNGKIKEEESVIPFYHIYCPFCGVKIR